MNLLGTHSSKNNFEEKTKTEKKTCIRSQWVLMIASVELVLYLSNRILLICAKNKKKMLNRLTDNNL